MQPARRFARTARFELGMGGATPSLRRVVDIGGGLGRWVRRVSWGTERFEAPVVEDVLPDGAVHLIFDLATSHRAWVHGPRLAPTRLTLLGKVEHVGVELAPGAVAAALGTSASAVVGAEVPLRTLWGDDAERLLDELTAMHLEARAAHIVKRVAERARRSATADELRVTRAAARLAADRGVTRIDALAEWLGVTERRLEQQFRTTVGLTPKELARVLRFAASMDELASGALPSLAGVAACTGFSDQAHLSREYRALAGASPSALADFGFFQAPLALID